MTERPKLTLFDLPETLELEVGGYLTVCDLISFLLTTKKASEYNRPSIWRELLSIANDTKSSSRAKKHKKRGVLKKALCKNVFRDTFMITWKAMINERRKSLSRSLSTGYDADMRLSIHKECIRTAVAAVRSRGLIVTQKQTTCKHNQLLLVHGKTLYPTTDHSESRELMLNKVCSNCSSMCYDRMLICASCKDSSGHSTNSCCHDCFDSQKFKKHHNHPMVEFFCPRDYFLQKEYTVGCFDCGIAYVVRIAGNYKMRWQKSAKCLRPLDIPDTPLSTVEFICTSRQNVFRNKLLSYEGKAELIFRMKIGDMLFHHSDDDLLSCKKSASLSTF